MIRSKGRLEREVSAAVTDYLSTRTDFFSWRANTSAGIAPSGQFMRNGKKGQSDVQGIQFPEGRFFSFELKRERGGIVGPDQERWLANIQNHGGVSVVVRSVEDVIAALGPVRGNIPKLVVKRVYHKGL